MQAKSHIGLRASDFLTDAGNFLADTGYWRAAIVIVAAAFLLTVLIAQFRNIAGIERGAEAAVARARQLLHEADHENRNVRPLPVSLASADVLRYPSRQGLRAEG